MKNNIVQAGFYETDITPDFPVALIGGPQVISTGTLHPLKAQVLLFKDVSGFFCIVTVDNLGFTVALSKALREKIAGLLNTDITHVMLCFSHTHAGPDPLSPCNGQRYYNELCEKLQQAVLIAKDNLAACKIAWSLGDVAIGENRRNGCDAVDTRLGALKIIEAGTEKPVALLLRVTAHNNVMMGSNTKLAGDYFSVAREKIAGETGCPVMMVQGAAGNIKPVGTDSIIGGEWSDLEWIATAIITAVRKLQFIYEDICRLQMWTKTISFTNAVPDAAQAERIAAGALATCGIDGSSWLAECERLRQRGIFTQRTLREIQYFRLNQGMLCGVPEEIFCELALDVVAQTENEFFFFNGYTNGCTAYLPTAAELTKGGYEVLYSLLLFFPFHGHVMPFETGSGEKLVQAVVEGYRQL